MSKPSKTLGRVLRGTADTNLRFDDLRNLLLHFGFAERVRGSHHIFTRDGSEEILNLQPHGNMAKPYQVKQVRNMLLLYGLAGVPEPTEISTEIPTTPEIPPAEDHHDE